MQFKKYMVLHYLSRTKRVTRKFLKKNKKNANNKLLLLQPLVLYPPLLYLDPYFGRNYRLLDDFFTEELHLLYPARNLLDRNHPTAFFCSS